jgi:hypothetical protein
MIGADQGSRTLKHRGPRRHRAWEYLIQPTTDPYSVEDLDALGALGWRMCGVVWHAGLLVHYFRRPARELEQSNGVVAKGGDDGRIV